MGVHESRGGSCFLMCLCGSHMHPPIHHLSLPPAGCQLLSLVSLQGRKQASAKDREAGGWKLSPPKETKGTEPLEGRTERASGVQVKPQTSPRASESDSGGDNDGEQEQTHGSSNKGGTSTPCLSFWAVAFLPDSGQRLFHLVRPQADDWEDGRALIG